MSIWLCVGCRTLSGPDKRPCVLCGKEVERVTITPEDRSEIIESLREPPAIIISTDYRRGLPCS